MLVKRSVMKSRLAFLSRKKDLIKSVIGKWNWYLASRVIFYFDRNFYNEEIEFLKEEIQKEKIMIYAENYNMLRVVGGMGGMMYSS